MSKDRKVLERMKNVLIAVLVISAILLGWQSRLFGNPESDFSVFTNILGRLGFNDNLGGGKIKIQTPGAAKPISIAATNDTGEHFGVRYDMNELTTVYNRAVLMMSDAFGSASAPREIDESDWRKALLSQGVYFEYISPVEISVLDGWFGTQISGEWGNMKIRRMCVAKTDGAMRLYFEQYGTGHYYTADTDVDADSAPLTDTFGVNGAVFAFEASDATAARDKYALLLKDSASHPIVVADNPLRDKDTLNKALAALGVTDQPSYKGNYIDNDFILTLNADGTALYRLRETGGEQGTALTDSQAIETARQAVAGSVGKFCGDAAVYFESVSADGTGGLTVRFRYIVAGGIVQLGQDGYAAAVTIRGGKITEMELRFRSYVISGEPKELLPEIQASAAADGAFVLCYQDTGTDRLEPFWIAAPAYPK